MRGGRRNAFSRLANRQEASCALTIQAEILGAGISNQRFSGSRSEKPIQYSSPYAKCAFFCSSLR